MGAVFSPFSNTSVTLDYYNIDIEDRLALRNNKIGTEEIELLQNAGVEDAALLNDSNANYFANAYDSEVSGIDIAITSDFELAGNLLVVDLRHNHNKQEVSNVAANTINASRVFDLENQVPSDRTTLTFDIDTGAIFSGYLRLNRYGDWESTAGLFGPTDASDTYSYGSEVLVDLEATFTLYENYKLAIGGENIFDIQPDSERNEAMQSLGIRHALTSPFGFNGGFWYLRASAEF